MRISPSGSQSGPSLVPFLQSRILFLSISAPNFVSIWSCQPAAGCRSIRGPLLGSALQKQPGVAEHSSQTLCLPGDTLGPRATLKS